MKIIDISMDISDDMISWPGDPAVKITDISSIPKDSANVSSLFLTSHTGTHIDAPCHFIEDGNSLNKIDLERFIGPCRVLDLSDKKQITKDILEPFNISKGERILLKTDNSNDVLKEFNKDFIALSNDAADYLAKKKIFLLGIDYLSVESFHSSGHYVHKKLLNNNILLLEGLRLAHINQDSYTLVCFPLKIDIDGSPVRAVLIKN